MPRRSQHDTATATSAGPGRATVAAAILAGGAGLVLGLPWLVPVRPDVAGESSLFGFHNGVAIVGLAATLLALLALELALPSPASAPVVSSPARRTRTEWIAIVACAVAGMAVVVGWWCVNPESYFGESAYFLTRLDMLALGRRPYRDFDYGYGPALLYAPFAAHRLSGGVLAADSAYVASVAAHHALGVLAASGILVRTGVGVGMRIGLLVGVTLAGFNITLGPIYALLRFLYPAWAVVTFHEPGPTAARIPRSLAAFLLAGGGLLISPEVGIATGAALLAGIVVASLARERGGVSSSLAIAAAPAAFVAAFGTESMATLLAFGGGAFNLPLLPAPYVLALLGLACLLLPRLAAEALRGGDGAGATASVAVALGMLLPAALGRCDPGHMLLNGLSLAMISVTAFHRAGAAAHRRLAASAAMILLLTHLFGQWNQYAPLVRDCLALRARLAAAAAEARGSDERVLRAMGPPSTDFGWAKRLPFPDDFLPLLSYDTLATPLGTPEDVDRLLKLSGRYLPVRHVPPNGGFFGPEAVDRVIADTLACDHVVLPAGFPLEGLPMSRQDYARFRSAWLSRLFLFPVALPARHDPWIAEIEIARRIGAEYVPVRTCANLVVLRRRDPRNAGMGQPAPGR